MTAKLPLIATAEWLEGLFGPSKTRREAPQFDKNLLPRSTSQTFVAEVARLYQRGVGRGF